MLTAGVAAFVVGGVYERFGRASAYGATAAGMLVLILIGLLLARPFLRSEQPKRRYRLPTTGEAVAPRSWPRARS